MDKNLVVKKLGLGKSDIVHEIGARLPSTVAPSQHKMLGPLLPVSGSVQKVCVLAGDDRVSFFGNDRRSYVYVAFVV